MFEGRRPLYGSFSMPPGMSITTAGGIADLVPLDGLPREMARTFADGRSAFVVNRHEEPPVLVCFDRPVQYEAELVHLQEVTGARIVQRTAVFGQVRLFADRRVVVVGRAELDRPADRRRAAADAARSARPTSIRPSPTGCSTSPCTGCHRPASAPRSSSTSRTSSGRRWTWRRSSTPRTLSITNRQHFPALFASLQQHDLATLVTADGSVEYLGVGLRSSAEAERTVDSDRGMRHRSAQRFSYDHPSTTIAVVSDNGPVTIFRQGRAIGLADTAAR